jgi:hypothetical protein
MNIKRATINNDPLALFLFYYPICHGNPHKSNHRNKPNNSYNLNKCNKANKKELCSRWRWRSLNPSDRDFCLITIFANFFTGSSRLSFLALSPFLFFSLSLTH